MALRIKQSNKNYIPDIVHPLSTAWGQPKREEITIDDTHAIMSQKTFDNLKNYSHSIPSGVYEGKMWKGEYYDKNIPTGKWYLRWFGLSDHPDMVSNHSRDIILI